MTTKLRFAAAALLPLVEHTEKATEHRALYGAKPEAGLWLVKDSGIYLMSSAKEALLGQNDFGVVKANKVVYAKGYDPDKDGDVYDKCVDAMGGDDGADCLPIAAFRDAIKAGAKTVVIEVKRNSLALLYTPGK